MGFARIQTAAEFSTLVIHTEGNRQITRY